MFGRCRVGVRGSGWLVHFGGFHIGYAPARSRDEIGQRCMEMCRTCRGSPAQRGCKGSVLVRHPEVLRTRSRTARRKLVLVYSVSYEVDYFQ